MRGETFGLTVTTLLGCPRKWRLMQSEAYWLRPADNWWAFRGQLMHGISATAAGDDPDALAEVRFSIPALTSSGYVVISGQPDLVYTDRRHLVDYKTTRSVPGPWRTWSCPETARSSGRARFLGGCGGWIARTATAGTRPRPSARSARRAYPRHIEQVSLYRLLLEENGLPVESAEIVYQDMERQVRVPVDLLPLESARTLLEERLRLHTTPELADILRDPEALWECDFCPVRAACERRHGSAVGRSAS
jgi:hypothetical protein